MLTVRQLADKLPFVIIRLRSDRGVRPGLLLLQLILMRLTIEKRRGRRHGVGTHRATGAVVVVSGSRW